MKPVLHIAALGFAAPAMAHGGPHLHPHGGETLVLIAGLIAALAGVALSRQR